MKDDGATDEADDAHLNHRRLYQFRFRSVAQESRQAVWNEIAPFLWRKMRRPSRVLDPAGGRGEFLNALPAVERWLVDLVDYPRPGLSPGINVVVGDVVKAPLPEGFFDGVFASNILEHLADADTVAAFLTRMRRVMAADGVVAVMGPNFKYCAREYFDCADHLLPLTQISVEEHLYAAGFTIFESHARFLPYSFRSRLPASAGLTRAYLQTPMLWRVLGRQFLVLARPETTI
jgi:ubiquinone/menaquinone biosynthesis C-methylase UbiE